MKKTFFYLFVIFIFSGLILPLISQAAAGTYSACPPDYPYYDSKDTKKCYEKIDADGKYSGNLESSITICYEGFVPCGLKKPIWTNGSISNGRCDGTKILKGTPCQFCHFFVMINGIINFVLIYIIPYLAVLFLVIGGIYFYFGGGKPECLKTGKDLIKGVFIGLFLIYGSYLLVGTFLDVLGVIDSNLANWATKGSPFSINCMIK